MRAGRAIADATERIVEQEAPRQGPGGYRGERMVALKGHKPRTPCYRWESS